MSCQKEDAETTDLVGAWNLTQHRYSAPGSSDTTTYAEGEVLYKFYEDKSLYIEAVNEQIQLKRWHGNSAGDSVFFDVGAPWAITDKTDETFTARLQPFIDAYSTYIFTKAE